MPATDHSPHTLVFTGDPDSIKGVGHLNDILHHHGLTSRFAEDFRPAGSSAVVVPVAGGDVHSALRALREAGEPDWSTDEVFVDGTFTRLSRGVGHGLTFTEVTPAEVPDGDWPTLPPKLRRPVVALLDNGVQPHEWLPWTPEDDPFLIDAEQDHKDGYQPWQPVLAPGAVRAHDDAAQSKAGHGTFIAGIVRQSAPYARVLSVRVMNEEGRAQETTVLAALDWLLGYVRSGHPVDVLCMAFGRAPGDISDEPLLQKIGSRLDDLGAEGVQLVASAGNDHQESAVYPAAFEAVTAVGAGFAGYVAQFSNLGDWVDRYRDGVNVQSILPGGGWAWWSGTSFAAANFAADLARPHVAR